MISISSFSFTYFPSSSSVIYTPDSNYIGPFPLYLIIFAFILSLGASADEST